MTPFGAPRPRQIHSASHPSRAGIGESHSTPTTRPGAPSRGRRATKARRSPTRSRMCGSARNPSAAMPRVDSQNARTSATPGSRAASAAGSSVTVTPCLPARRTCERSEARPSTVVAHPAGSHTGSAPTTAAAWPGPSASTVSRPTPNQAGRAPAARAADSHATAAAAECSGAQIGPPAAIQTRRPRRRLTAYATPAVAASSTRNTQCRMPALNVCSTVASRP